jgi:hypothetical protein
LTADHPFLPLQGNLSEFVKVKPEAKTYYELAAATLRFKFPEPVTQAIRFPSPGRICNDSRSRGQRLDRRGHFFLNA